MPWSSVRRKRTSSSFDDAADLRLRVDEPGVGGAHLLDDRVGERREEGLLDADGHGLLHGAADDAPQHVVAAVVAGQDAVHDRGTTRRARARPSCAGRG